MEEYKARIKEGVLGKAIHIVPISENPVNRAVFNGVVSAHFGRDLASTYEIERVSDLMHQHDSAIKRALDIVGIIDTDRKEDMLHIENAVKREVGKVIGETYGT